MTAHILISFLLGIMVGGIGIYGLLWLLMLAIDEDEAR